MLGEKNRKIRVRKHEVYLVSQDHYNHDLSKSQILEMLKEKEAQYSVLKSERDLLLKIIALMPGNVFWKDKDGIFLGCNNNVAKILGLQNTNEIIGKRNHDLFNAALAIEADNIDKTVTLGQEQFIEENGINAEQKPAIYLTKKQPLFDDKKNIIGIMGVSFDISERKKMESDLRLAKEKAEASNRAKSRFLALINHELRTPLTGIIGLIDILKKTDLSGIEAKSIITDLESCSQYLHTMVNNVLEFTKLEAGKVKPNKNPVNLIELTCDVFNILSALAKNKDLELFVKSNKNIPIILTDAKLINQILLNLISNAIKFTNTGSIIVHIRCKNIIDNIATIELAIQDTGIGIPHDNLDHIFEPFRQLEDTYVRQTSISGTGLGLSIVKRLSELLNVEIHVMSEYGKGSTFSLIGQFDIQQKNQMQHIKETKTPCAQTLRNNIRVLLVEDDKIVQHIHKNMLSELGCKVIIANCGAEALNLPNNHDIAFVDIGLSDMSGFDLIKNIRSNDNYSNDFPIIALTGYTGEIEKANCLASGANEVAAKPISIKQLEEILLRYLG